MFYDVAHTTAMTVCPAGFEFRILDDSQCNGGIQKPSNFEFIINQ